MSRENARGPGSVVVERSLPTSPGVRASASLYLTEAQRQGVTPGRRMLDVGPEPSEAHIAQRFGISPGELVFARRKLMLADDVPVRIATSFFRLDLAEGTPLTAPDFVPGGLQVALDELGYRFGSATETLTARLPTVYEATTLELDENAPVVRVLRSSYDYRDRPVHTLETVCAADRHVFHIQQVTGSTDTDAF